MSEVDVSIETLLQEKLMLYRDLAETLKEEKKRIVQADVDALWKISDKKQTITNEIQGVRGRILQLLHAEGICRDMDVHNFQIPQIVSLMPISLRKRLVGVQVAIMTLKEEIRSFSRENKRYIEYYLGVLDELMAVLTGADQQKPLYSAGRRASTSGGYQIHYREA